MPAPKALAGLPKPVLFGLYGAVGGLLGALVFGEILFRLLEPEKAQAAKPEPQTTNSKNKIKSANEGIVEKSYFR